MVTPGFDGRCPRIACRWQFCGFSPTARRDGYFRFPALLISLALPLRPPHRSSRREGICVSTSSALRLRTTTARRYPAGAEAPSLWAAGFTGLKAGASTKTPAHPDLLYVVALRGEVFEARRGVFEGQLDEAGRAVALFGYDDFGDAFEVGIVLFVDLFAEDEGHDVGVLLDGAGFAQVGELRTMVASAAFGSAA